MRQFGVSVYTNNDFHWSFNYIYTNGAWAQVHPYVYTGGAWKEVGGAGTQMVKMLTSDGKDFLTNDGGYFLVREA